MKDLSQPMLPIRYRGFYDVPGMFVVEYEGKPYMFYCAFNEKTEEFSDVYKVYTIPDDVYKKFDEANWTGLENLCKQMGTIPVKDVVFDETARQAVHSSIFEKIATLQKPTS